MQKYWYCSLIQGLIYNRTKGQFSLKMLLGKPADECHRKLVSNAIQVQLLYMYKPAVNAT